MLNQILIIPAIGAFIASIVSIINLYYIKKRMISDTFPQFRYERHNLIREAINDFVNIYFEEADLEPENRKKLRQALLKAELTFNYMNTSSCLELKNVLYKYLNSNDIIVDHTHLINETHKLLNWLMAKAKFEAGITPKIDMKNREKLIKQLKKYSKYKYAYKNEL